MDISQPVSRNDRFWNARRYRRHSLNRVENGEQLTPSQETVVPGFFGYVINPRFLRKSIGWYHRGPCLLHTERF